MHEPFVVDSLLLPLIFLFGIAMLTSFSTCLLLLGKYKSQDLIRTRSKLFFFRSLLHRFFSKSEWENLYLMISFTKHILHLLYATSAFFFALSVFDVFSFTKGVPDKDWLYLLFIALSIIGISIGIDFLMRLFCMMKPRPLFTISAPFTSIFLIVFFPIVGPLLKITRFFFKLMKIEDHPGDFLVRDKIKEMIRDSGLNLHLDVNDQKLITSFITFRERVAKEIMVPRIDVTTLPMETKIRDASKLFLEEGYSRIPVFRETFDEIVGVLLYKDLLKFYMENEGGERDRLLDNPIETLVKPVIYAPENKKISQLLQEFRAKQLHLAIVVDEYGGTEGIVTIEDILEELVGEIEDEYDVEEEETFWKLPNGSWIVDAKMSIIDIESKLGVHIPQHPEYETIGGYIFHRAGTIPTKGWSIHHDAFDLEVLSSSDRSIEKIRITPRLEPEES